MARNGAGVYSLPSPPSPFLTGQTISATDMMTVLNDIATAMTGSIARDGQSKWTGNQDADSHSISNVTTLSAASGVFANLAVSTGATSPVYAVGVGGPSWTKGTGAPLAVQPKGSIYSRTDGGVGTTLYVSQGAGTWNPIAGV